jgi:hypothetical protein
MILLVGLTSCNSQPQKKALPTIYLIDSGTTGWVKILYNRPDEKDLPVENGFAVAHLGPDLKLFTRSRMNQAWDGAQFYYQTADGKRVRLSSADSPDRRIWAQDKTNDDTSERETFFVGSQEELSAHLNFQQDIGGGLVAPPKDPRAPTPEQRDARDVINTLPK